MSGNQRINLVLTVIGNDRPGLVESLAATVSSHQGNWLDSSMSHLAGKFAGILRIEIAANRVDALKLALEQLSALRIVVEGGTDDAPCAGRQLTLSLVGHDRIGIVREVSQVIARHGVNVESLTTRTASAPMSAEALFHADAELLAPTDLDTRALKTDLERISNDLMVDIKLGEIV